MSLNFFDVSFPTLFLCIFLVISLLTLYLSFGSFCSSSFELLCEKGACCVLRDVTVLDSGPRASSFSLVDSLNCLRKTRKFLPFSSRSVFQRDNYARLWRMLAGGEFKPSDANLNSCLDPQTHRADVNSILMRGGFFIFFK